MSTKLKSVLSFILPVIFWLGVWQLLSLIFNSSFLFPGIPETLRELIFIVSSENFFITIASTLFRVLLGITFGTLIAIVLAALSYRFAVVKALVSPAIGVIKSTPVASFVIIFWIIMSGSALPVAIALLMVMPIIWQNMMDGYEAIDRELYEVAVLFEFSYQKRLKLLIFPTLVKYLLPALVTSVGLAWKSEIAAEIIAYTTNSVGAMINDAKFDFNSPRVFAWTFIIIIFSIFFEWITKKAVGRIKK